MSHVHSVVELSRHMWRTRARAFRSVSWTASGAYVITGKKEMNDLLNAALENVCSSQNYDYRKSSMGLVLAIKTWFHSIHDFRACTYPYESRLATLR